jgi:hypothetical protein
MGGIKCEMTAKKAMNMVHDTYMSIWARALFTEASMCIIWRSTASMLRLVTDAVIHRIANKGLAAAAPAPTTFMMRVRLGAAFHARWAHERALTVAFPAGVATNA